MKVDASWMCTVIPQGVVMHIALYNKKCEGVGGWSVCLTFCSESNHTSEQIAWRDSRISLLEDI